MASHFRDGLILTPEREGVRAERGTITIEGSRIARVVYGERAGTLPVGPDEEIVDASAFLIIPGLVDAHAHLYGALAPGLIERLPLDVRMPALAACLGGWSERDTWVTTALGAARMLASGTTTVLENVLQGVEATGPAVRALLDTGIRAVVAPMIGDRAYADTMPGLLERVPEPLRPELGGAPPGPASEQVDACLALADRWHGAEDRISCGLSPSAPHRCSDRLLELVAGASRDRGLPIHTHLLETRAQAVIGRRLYGRSMVEHLHALGLLDGRFSGAHAVWLTDRDLDLMAESGGAISHNPMSNLYLGSGIARIPDLLRRGVTVGIGSDGANCGSSTVLFEVLKLAAIAHRVQENDRERWASAADAFRMATIGGARALGLEREVGSIEPGKRADLVLIDASAPGLVPLNEPVVQLVFGVTNADVSTVLVDGRVVARQGRPTRIDPARLRGEARELGRRIAERARARLVRLAPLEPHLMRSYLELVAAYEAGNPGAQARGRRGRRAAAGEDAR